MEIEVRKAETNQDYGYCAAIRTLVFREEQDFDGTLKDEFDEHEDTWEHFLILEDEEPVGTARYILRKKGVGQIGRVAIIEEKRSLGYGRVLIEHVTEQLKANPNVKKIMMSAQDHAIPFYEGLGYQVAGEGYMSDGIPHHKIVMHLDEQRMGRITGINHITFAVSDLEKSLEFYQGVLGLHLQKTAEGAAYLDAGGTLICLSYDKEARKVPANDYSHVALSVRDFQHLRSKLRQAGVKRWRETTDEGSSFYFLDPNGHKLEIHVDEESRAQYLEKRREERAANKPVNKMIAKIRNFVPEILTFKKKA